MSMNGLAGLYESQGKYNQAEPLYVECFAKRKELLGYNHPSTLMSLDGLALLNESQGKYFQAKPL